MAIEKSKSSVIGLMAVNDAIRFAMFLEGASIPSGAENMQKQIKALWNSIDSMNIEHPVFQTLLTGLISIGILSEASLSNVQSCIDNETKASKTWSDTELKEYIQKQVDYSKWIINGNDADIAADMQNKGYKTVSHMDVAKALRGNNG